ncbi:DUF4365 domain-containing protein [Mesorhizobium sp. B263B2A]|uniref:DUF4365 domain-containing protein n=1 Tax=Mesorhizobium sp. B263B2A TaxID=2876669 RepID=UPI001CD0DA20|nr:DUF4365 domain-containing protein [Mesorhizobium sp. B263B2A]MCA0032886.1 hypothetical protein [Mesorhizobium sp. B263B2A]
MRPDSHRTGDVGASKVRTLFLESGWVVNDIVSDYGEDVVIQPSRLGVVEKHRVYVQIKTISDDRNRAISIKSEDAFVWQFSKEPFLLVAWSISSNSARYIWINRERDPKRYVAEKKTVSFQWRNMHDLSPKAILHIEAEARNWHYSEILSSLARFIEENGGYKKRDSSRSNIDAKQAAARIACIMLEKDGVFLKKGKNYYANIYYILKYIDTLVVENDLLCKSTGKRYRFNSLWWSVGIVRHAWNDLYGNEPSPGIYWSLVNSVEALIGQNPAFRRLIGGRRRQILDAEP